MFEYSWLILLFPILGVLINTIFGLRLKGNGPGIMASAAVGLAFAVSIKLFFDVLQLPADQRLIENKLFTWIATAGLSTEIAMQIDPLSLIMILVVTGVSFIIHIYAIGYMHGDRGFARFFVYLNLFVSAMLILVTANNFLMMFVGWEGVGLCSYLLIGFWYENDYNAFAGRKAFVVNRIGDFGFLLAIFLIFGHFGTLDFTEVFSQASAHFAPGSTMVTLIALLLFVGATGKSAQIPLYIWLPDAMAGPTPVSALIHAATMVTAGVYMVARANILFTLAPIALDVVAVIGAATAFFAATIGLTQFDIKRVLAYSTVSQLGYMFLALGVGSFTAGVFHLMTHAFFKALLFLGAGSVMHAMSNRTDMRIMGGLKQHLPVTYWTMLIGTLAIAGIPGFSGFFSKDEILWQAFTGINGHPLLWLIGLIAAAITTFYMFRLIFMTFFGTLRADHEISHHVHESPKVMTLPLVALAVLSVIGGYVGIPAILGGSNHFEHFLQPVFEASEKIRHQYSATAAGHFSHSMEWGLMAAVLLITLASLYLAHLFYVRKTDLPAQVTQKIKGLYTLVYNKYFIDELYEGAVTKPLQSASNSFLWKIVDVKGIDGLVNGIGRFVANSGRALTVIQTGYVQNYALIFVLGVIALLASLWF
jgi:NADH-quinone oxidoreductase subunit L